MCYLATGTMLCYNIMFLKFGSATSPHIAHILCYFSAAKLGSVDPLPFFDQTAEENKENGSFQYMGSSELSHDTLGVPTHFQNDGSVLYLLTHAFSPPSAVAVGQWLPQQVVSRSLSGISTFLHIFLTF